MKTYYALALVLCVGAAWTTAQTSRPALSSAAKWQPGTETFQKIMARCVNAPQADQCRAKAMREAGASAQAVAFAKLTGYYGFMRAFRETGAVDIAYALYPYRANENNGFLLVNGEPQVVDVDDYKLIPEGELKANPIYANLLRSNPELSVFPGDRSDTRYPVAEKLPGGGQRFLVSYVLQTCHACAQLATATFAFDFDAKGKFIGVKLRAVTPSTN